MYERAVAILAACLLTTVTNKIDAAPPATEQRPFSYELHGQTLTDPYLWLEGSDAPELQGEDAELDADSEHWARPFREEMSPRRRTPG